MVEKVIDENFDTGTFVCGTWVGHPSKYVTLPRCKRNCHN